MREKAQNILAGCIALLLVYALGSFIELSFNPGNWEIEARIIFGIAWLILICIIVGTILFED
jgi:hypothetical protein